MQPLTSALVFPENLRETNRSFTAFGVLIVLLVLFRVEFYSKQLKDESIDFITGEASYERQGRAIVLGKNKGAIEVYIERESQMLLGAELFTEATEHMAHLLSWIISEELTLNDILEKPFYHPTLEEGLRTALKHARRQLK